MKKRVLLLMTLLCCLALVVGILAACNGDEGTQTGTPGDTQTPGGQTPGGQIPSGGDVEPAKLIFKKNGNGYSVTGYEGMPTFVVIPETYEGLPVTSIENRAFIMCFSLTSVTIGESVTSIGEDAFANCNKLIEVYNKSSLDIVAGSTDHGEVARYAKHVYTEEGGSWLSDAGNGFRFFYDGEIGYLVGYHGNETDLTLPSSFTAYDGTEGTSYQIYWGAFLWCNDLTSVTIPDSVTSIGSGAFAYCTSLTSVTIGEGVTSIGETVFSYCIGLNSIVVEEGNATYHSAGNCLIETATKTLVVGCKSSVIPDDGSVMSIESYAFFDCTSLTSVIIPDSVTSIGEYAFYDCISLTSVTIGNSVTSIGEAAFSDCTSLTSIIIPDSVTSIGDRAFYDCTDLTSVTIGSGVTSIGEYAFYDCDKLIEVYNKSDLDITAGSSNHGYVGYYAKHVYTEEGNSWLSDTEDGFRFFYDGGIGYLVAYLGDETKLTLPEIFTTYDGTVVSEYQINDYAFYDCSGLTSITIPNSVTSIGRSAFWGCISLTSVTIPDSVTRIGSSAFYSCDKLIEVYNKSDLDITAGSSDHGYVGYYAKHVYTEEGNSWLSDTEDGFRFLWDGEAGHLVAYLGDEAELSLPDSFTAYDGTVVSEYQINDYAFYNCASLISVTIPDSVASIGEYAFYDCDSLEAVYITDIVKWLAIDFGGHTANPLYYAGDLYLNGELVTDLVIPDGVTSIGNYVFHGCDSLTSITIPNSVTSIGEAAFSSCDSLTSVTIGNGVTSIGNYAFQYCSGLTSITIPSSVTRIESYVFSDCTSLTSVTIPDSVISMGWFVFRGCNSLASVTIGSSMTNIGENAFEGCHALESIVIPDSVTDIEYGAFWDCTAEIIWGDSPKITEIGYHAFSGYKGTSITIPDSVTSIGEEAFSGCTAEIVWGGMPTIAEIGGYAFYGYAGTSITIPDSVTSIGDSAFYNCSGLTSVTIPDGVTSIGRYSFSHCTGLISVTFKGTKAEWDAITKEYGWNEDCPFTEVVCSDGTVSV